MNGEKICKAQEMLCKAMKEMKKEIRKDLSDVAPLDGVTPIPGNIRCAKVSIAAICASPGFSLSPSYYIQDCQTEAVSSYLLADNISFDIFQERLEKCITDKAVTFRGDKTLLNPNTITALKQIRAELGV